MTDSDLLKRQVARELTLLDAADAERLSSIMRGLLACLQDLDGRVQALEAANGNHPPEPVNPQQQLPCAIRTWHLPSGATGLGAV